MRLSSQELAQNVIDKYSDSNPREPILTGTLIKRNRYYMHQERHFELYTNGQLKYSNQTGEVLGTLILSRHSKVIKVGRNHA